MPDYGFNYRTGMSFGEFRQSMESGVKNIGHQTAAAAVNQVATGYAGAALNKLGQWVADQTGMPIAVNIPIVGLGGQLINLRGNNTPSQWQFKLPDMSYKEGADNSRAALEGRYVYAATYAQMVAGDPQATSEQKLAAGLQQPFVHR